MEQKDRALAQDIRDHIKALAERRSFGLNFERHTPETVELPGRPIRKGDKVRFLAPRGADPKSVDQHLWRVMSITRNGDGRTASLARQLSPDSNEFETVSRACDLLIVVAEFRDPIYPGLVSTGKVERGSDKPFHTVINAENFHALQTLLYTHEAKVDAIYIDPPYNTGDSDWKYNNDYVDSDDIYRHSKWLAFMERRLKMAKRLLRPDNSVLIVTIDEKEYLRLGLLLEQTFPEADIQMVSSVINRAASFRKGRFARVDEYIFYVFVGQGHISPWVSTMLDESVDQNADAATEQNTDEGTGQDPEERAPKTTAMPTVWFTAVRRGTGSAERSGRPALFYPVILDAASGALVKIGDPLPKDAPRSQYPLEPGTVAVWPLAKDGREQRWRFSATKMREYFAAGTARLGKRDAVTGLRPITYLQPGTLTNISNGTFVVTGKSPEGALELALADGAMKDVTPRSVWNQTSHFARDHGTNLVKSLLGEKRFEFPKSLYAVEDSLRFIVADKPNAVIVDFFAGSGTTAHAVMRLNRQDGGRRQSISVTNNEVSAEEQAGLRSRGLRPGDAEWEALGICDYVTKPRIQAAVTGLTPSGNAVKTDYKFTDEFPIEDGFEENVEFFTMTYEAPRSIAHHRSFEAVAPILWLKSGAKGTRIDRAAGEFAVADTYGVLFDLDASRAFLDALVTSELVRMAYIVTDDDRAFQMICSELPPHVEPIRLYESYLTNFKINTGRE
ncbi:site-specific DNA-methyltransferase [Streptomyces sp. NPDC056704]|uniref:site-specific DNA-methyltransferase n=1 Tax=Streptomyces sp. NPDC056704 TaxID=3345917 RepID=UPI00368C380D